MNASRLAVVISRIFPCSMKCMYLSKRFKPDVNLLEGECRCADAAKEIMKELERSS